jgi:hypothetical protein
MAAENGVAEPAPPVAAAGGEMRPPPPPPSEDQKRLADEAKSEGNALFKGAR